MSTMTSAALRAAVRRGALSRHPAALQATLLRASPCLRGLHAGAMGGAVPPNYTTMIDAQHHHHHHQRATRQFLATLAEPTFDEDPKPTASEARGDLLSERIMPPFDTLSEMLRGAVKMHGDRPALGTKRNGKYEFDTYNEIGDMVERTRAGFAALGLAKGDTVGIISRNRLEWVLTAYAGYDLGCINVPMYEQQKPSDWEYIIKDSDCKVLIASTVEVYEKVKPHVGKLGHLQHLFCCDLPADHPASFQTILAAGAKKGVDPIPLEPDHLATLIYTSGTTGTPKGVMLSHSNLVSNIKDMIDHNPKNETVFGPDDRTVSFLPWAHSYGQTCELHSGLAFGGSSGIAAGAPGDAVELLANIQEVKPSVLFSVPTLFKKVYDGVHKRMDEAPLITRTLMRQALKVGDQVRRLRAEGKEPTGFLAWQFNTLDRIVLAKIRQTFGGNLKAAIVAGAPTPVPVIEFMETLGISMTEGYGLTETSPVVAITFPEPSMRVLGTVGKAIPNVEIKIVDHETLVECPHGTEGELWVSGPNVLQGYWKKPEETKKVIQHCDEGKRWFRTGDLATLIDDNHIKITGRIKDQYKLENGKYVAPAPIENAFSLNLFVNQCLLYGDGKPHNVILIVPDFPAITDELKLDPTMTPEQICEDASVREFYEGLVQDIVTSNGIKKYEAPKKILLVSEAFSAANEMLTPKLSVRKPNVLKVYRPQLDALYEK